VITLHGFSATLGGRPVLQSIDLAVGPGEFVALCGPNGAGKTTLLRAIAGLLPGGKARPRDLAYLEQGARCAWGMTIRQVVALGRIPHGDGDEAAVSRALAVMGLTELAGRRIDQVSGGQARRAMLARALATSPKVLLLDEPVADLDPAAAHRIMALLAGFAQAGGSVVAVLHALDLCARYATRMVVLADGRIMADGAPDAVLPAAGSIFGLDVGVDDTPRLLPPTAPGSASWC
jgi:iron complex transport system ATP-binding protein